MKRIEALQALYPHLRSTPVVTIMGAVAAELHSLGHKPNFFYLEHAMGLASSMGLGIALCRPEHRVVVLDGDGSLLMNLGTLTTMARYHPPNLLHIVFDNQSLLSVGGFPTATATGTDLAAIARAAGVQQVWKVETVPELEAAIEETYAVAETTCIIARVDAVGPATFHMDVTLLENRFQFGRFFQEHDRHDRNDEERAL